MAVYRTPSAADSFYLIIAAAQLRLAQQGAEDSYQGGLSFADMSIEVLVVRGRNNDGRSYDFCHDPRH